MGLSLNSPIKIATENTLFGMPETKIGFFCDVGVSHFLSRVPHGVGLYCGLTANFVKGQDLVKTGLATHYVKSENIPKLEETLKKKITKKTKLGDISKMINKFEEKLTPEPFKNFKEIKYYFDN